PIILGTVAVLGTAAATCLLAAKDRCPLRSATPIAARAS
ncbi:sulfite exporter TauE/SafE family protein, partial [Dietzia sp. B44]|nr:sulfite exporter TauE/SafE family protein [Dietzia sp. B44]